MMTLALAGLAGCGSAAEVSSPEAPLLRSLKTLTEADLGSLADPAEARALLEAFDRTVRTFPHGYWGARDPSAAMPSAFSDLHGGWCDSAVEGFRRLARELGVRASVINLNLNLHDPGYGLRGHTIAAVATADGQWLFDPLYGIAVRTGRDTLDDAILSSPHRQAYRSTFHTNERGPTLTDASTLYGHVDDDRFSAAPNDEPFLSARSPWIHVGERVQLGTPDGSGIDLVERFGSHFDYLGSLYTPMRHEWRFEGLEPGRDYRVEFRFAGHWGEPLAATIIVDDGTTLLQEDVVVMMGGEDTLTKRFVPQAERATLTVTPAPGFAAAWLDAVTVEAASPSD
jgi:hypothetical protein